jgi:dihydrofolate synthase / folylpolyglutamate synthase
MDLAAWLLHIRSLHPQIIDYSLERIRVVAARMDLLKPSVPIILVTGTNGKGSTIAAMQAILLAAKYQVGSFTSPYLLKFNEQICLNGKEVTDAQLMEPFAAIEEARGEISLSEFEFTTLAALFIFKRTPLDIILFEVGLGGGNDATNIIDPEVTVITSIALDHEEYLGNTLEEIASSEAQLLRPHKIGVLGETLAPESLHNYAKQIDSKLCYIAQNFHFNITENTWDFYNESIRFNKLPIPIIMVKNAALALQALLSCGIKFSEAQLIQGLNHIKIQGRLQFVAGKPSLLFDVAHNLEAIENLRAHLEKAYWPGKVIAVFSMFKDKKIAETIKMMAPYVDQWLIAPIDHPRGASMAQLQAAFQDAGIKTLLYFKDLTQAYTNAKKMASADDLILAFGSFFVVRTGLVQK